MSDAERRLAELFAADLPPAADRAFAFAILERVERRRAWLDMLEIIPFVIAAGALLSVLAPFIEQALQSSLAAISSPVFAAALVLTLTALIFAAGGNLRELWETAFY